MRHLYLGFFTLLSAFAFLSNAHAQGANYGIASNALHKQTYLIDRTIPYTQYKDVDDSLHLQANFRRPFGDWKIKFNFL